MKTFFAYRQIRMGSALQMVIHAAVDRAPISRHLKRRIKNCPGCNRRARTIDRAARKLVSIAL